MSPHYPRDMIGYGATPPDPRWPNGARLALQIVLNYEEGAERSVLHGDPASETFLSEIVGAEGFTGVRHLSMESLYEYGSRVGVWRLLRVFQQRKLPLTVFGVAMALERNPEAVAAMVEGGHEIASHGWRWISYQFVDADTEREHIALAVEIDREAHRTAAARLVYGARQSQHASPGGGARRFSLRRGLLCRRLAVLGVGQRQAAPRHPVHARLQRHAFRAAGRILDGR